MEVIKTVELPNNYVYRFQRHRTDDIELKTKILWKRLTVSS